jgi:hypothetical protein
MQLVYQGAGQSIGEPVDVSSSQSVYQGTSLLGSQPVKALLDPSPSVGTPLPNPFNFLCRHIAAMLHCDSGHVAVYKTSLPIFK